MGLYIVNGRTKGDSLGRLTYCSYLGSSTVDYAITDLDQSQINYFTVMPQLPCTHVENMIDSFILTSFGEEKKTINLATEQLLFSLQWSEKPWEKENTTDVKKK